MRGAPHRANGFAHGNGIVIARSTAMTVSAATTPYHERWDLSDRDRLQPAEIEHWQAEAHEWRLQYLINHSFVQCLFRSPAWRLLRPLRAGRQLLRPRGFSVNDL